MLSPEELQQKQQELEQKRELKKQLRKQRIVRTVVYSLLALLLIAASAYYTFQTRFYYRGTNGVDTPVYSSETLTDRVNILLLGTDEKSDDVGRTDTIMLASIDPKSGDIGVLSIPRDTRVFIPSRQKYDRINATYAYGGAELTRDVLQGFLGVDIDYYVKVSFRGFEDFIDVLGGITIDVEKDMKYDDNAQNLHIDLAAGEQVLDGEQALGYVRFRSDGFGDVALVDVSNRIFDGRISRQQKFVKALANRVLQPATVIKLPRLIRQLAHTVETDMPIVKAVQLGYAMRNFDGSGIKTGLIPGMPESLNGASYWVPNELGTKLVVSELLLGEQVICVEILNGSGIAGLAGKAATYLAENGIDVIKIGNADHFNYRQTHILAHKDTQLAEEIAHIVGGQATISAAEPVISDADVTVILGWDFKIDS